MSGHDLSDLTYDHLKDMIVHGRLKPEKRLVEEELAELCGVSRTPVRDALTRLRNEGYVREAGGGARARLEVAPLCRADVDELWTILGNLETDAAKKAAELPDTERRALVTRLRAVNHELEETARQRGSPDDLMSLQSAFHRVLVDATAGPWLVRIYELVRPHAERYEWVYGSLREADLSLSTAEHERIISLIEDGRGDAAAGAIRAHWEEAKRRTGGLIERYWE